MNSHDLNNSASVIGTKPYRAMSGGTGSEPLPQTSIEFYGPVVASASLARSPEPELKPKWGGSVNPGAISWGHFSEIDDGYGRDVHWSDNIPLWSIFILGFGLGVALAWLVF